MPDFLRKLLRVLLAVALGAVALVFASLIVALAVTAGLAFGAWFWWRTRQLRRARPTSDPSVIEGEYRVVRDVKQINS